MNTLNLKKISSLFITACLAFLFLTACSSTPSSNLSLKEDLTTGSWQGKVQGMEIEFKFTDTHVKVESLGMEFLYTLEEDQLNFDIPEMGPMSFTIKIEGDTLIQTDNVDGAITQFIRKN